MPLTDQEIETYRRDGLVIPSAFRLPAETLKRIDQLYQELLHNNRDNADFSPDFILGPHLDASGTYGIKGDPAWLEFARIPEILDMVEQLIGPDLILWGVTIFGKPARNGKATPWHQDGDYYPIEPLETLTVWISLDGSTPEQGCMKFIPGSHRDQRIYSHHFEHRDDYTLAQVIDDDQVDLDRRATSCSSPARFHCTMSTWCTAPRPIARTGGAWAWCCASCRRPASTTTTAARSRKMRGRHTAIRNARCFCCAVKTATAKMISPGDMNEIA